MQDRLLRAPQSRFPADLATRERRPGPPDPHQRVAPGLVRWAVLCGCLVACVGCSSKAPPPELAEARRLLQLDRVQPALDVLAAMQGDPTAEGHYLKAIALDRLQMKDVAAEEIRIACEQQPENTKYRGLSTRFRLYDALEKGKADGADELIQMYREHPTAADAAMFAFYAHQAKRMQLTAQAKLDAAEKEHQASLQALNTAIALSSAIPEFQREMLSFALVFEMGDSAKVIADKLMAVDATNVELLQDRVRVLMLTGQPEEAVAVAAELHQRKKRDETSAEILAKTLTATGPDVTRDRQFRDLCERYPENQTVLQAYLQFLVRGGATDNRDRDFEALLARMPNNDDVLAQYAVYLGRSGRTPKGCEVLVARARSLQDLPRRWKLINVALSLAIESGEGTLARQLLDRHNAEVPHQVTRSYLDGRVLYLQKDFAGAEQRMLEIVNMAKDDVPALKTMAAEALRWIEIIRRERAAAAVLEQAAAGLNPAQASPSNDPASETRADGTTATDGQ